jgi:hypothetical protein
MKKLKISLPVLCLGLVLAAPAKAQIDEIDFIKGGIEDAEQLFQGYMTPFGNAFGADLNAGWYNTAKPHKLGGFDVTITVNAAWAPSEDKLFDLADLMLDGMVIGDTESPTIMGKQTDNRPRMSYTQNEITVAEYTMPNGSGLNLVPLPMAQVGVGLPFGTEINGRFLPSLNFGDYGNIGLWGVGLKHSIFQHIPVLKKLPVLEGSVQGGYTKMNSFANIEFLPDDNATVIDLNPTLWLDQKLIFEVEAWTVNLVFSQTLPVITFYQGIGYSNSSTQIALEGNYPISRLETDPGSDYFGEVVVGEEDVYTDPLDIEILNSKDLRLNAGFRIKLGVLTIHFDYTRANYSTVTGGLGISFR